MAVVAFLGCSLVAAVEVVTARPTLAQETGASAPDYPITSLDPRGLVVALLLVIGALVGGRLWVVRRRGSRFLGVGSPTSIETGERARPLWPTALVLIGLAALAVFVAERGLYVSDNRFVLYWDPGKALAQLLTAWDSQPNAGGTTALFGIPLYAFVYIVRLLGASPWMAERILMATLVGGGAVGAALVTREFLPRARVAPAVAGLWWIAAPYTMAYVLPSALYLNATLAPWMVWTFVRGVGSTSRWRWAAAFAFVVGLSGFFNGPALGLAAIALVPVALYMLGTGKATWRSIFGWSVRAAPLVVAVLLPSLIRAGLVVSALAKNLSISETAQAVNQSSSWPESLRGLGDWLVYWNPNGILVQPFLARFLNSVPVILISFVPVIVAFAVVLFLRRRARLLFGTMLLFCTAIMVGGFPITEPSPYGWLLFRLYEKVPTFFTFRNSYKAGGGALLAAGFLVAYGVEWVLGKARRERSWRWARPAAVVAVVGTVLVTSSPMWTGAMFRETETLRAIPSYWYEATSWLDQQPGASRSMILPGVYTEYYTWGVGSQGDILESLMDRPFVMAAVLMSAQPATSNLINAVDASVMQADYQPGTIAPIAERLGVEYLVLRNDLNWRRGRVARPAQLDGLRSDPDLQLVATFGERGESMLDPTESSPEADRERQLPPIEIYRVDGVSDVLTRAVSGGPSLLVSGDGAAWPSMAVDGTLDRTGPIRYTPRLTNDDLGEELSQGASVVVTDTNKRVPPQGRLGPVAAISEVDVTRAVDLFSVPGSQSVASFGDATSIATVGERFIGSFGPEHRPAAAFNGNPGDSWLTSSFGDPNGTGIRVSLKEPSTISSMTLSAARGPGYRQVIDAEIQFDDGTVQPIDLAGGGPLTVRFPARTVSRFDLVVTGVTGVGIAPYGFSGVAVPGLDLIEAVQLPDDVFRLAGQRAETVEAIGNAPISYRFDRQTARSADTESRLRRRFFVANTRPFAGRGTLQVEPSVSDQQLGTLLGVSAVTDGSSRRDGLLTNAAPLAVDGALSTGWEASAGPAARLVSTFPDDRISEVEVALDTGSEVTTPDEVTIQVGSERRTVPVPSAPECPPTESCPVFVRASFTPGDDQTVTVTLPELGRTAPPVRVLEVTRNRSANPSIDEDASGECRFGLASMDGSPLGIRLVGTTAELLGGGLVEARLCDDVSLTAGWHTFSSGFGVPFDSFVLDSDSGSRPVGVEPTPVGVTGQTNTDIQATVGAGPPGWLLSGQGFNEGWKVPTGGESFGPVTELDTLSGWSIPARDSIEVSMTFGPQRVYTASLVISVAGFVLAVGLMAVDPRTSVRATTRRRWRGWRVVADVVTLVFAVAIGGLPVGVVALIAMVCRRRNWISARGVGFVCLALICLAAAASVPPVGPGLGLVFPGWPIQRELAQAAAVFSAALLAVVIEDAFVRRQWDDDDGSGEPSPIDLLVLGPDATDGGDAVSSRGEDPDQGDRNDLADRDDADWSAEVVS